MPEAVLEWGQVVQTIPASVEPPHASSIPPSIDAGALLALQSGDEAARNPPPASTPDDGGTDDGAMDAAAGDATLVDSSVGVDATNEASAIDAGPGDASPADP